MSTNKIDLNRQRIAAAGLRIADEHGFAAVTMRRVADNLQVGTMSLYHYVKNKTELVQAMDDALMAEVLLPALPDDWINAISAIARTTHAMYLRHPWSVVSMASAPPARNAMRHMEQCLEALEHAPMTAQGKLDFLFLLDDFLFGNALRNASANLQIDRNFARQQIATGEFPRIKDCFINQGIEPDGDRLEAGIAALISAAVQTDQLFDTPGE